MFIHFLLDLGHELVELHTAVLRRLRLLLTSNRYLLGGVLLSSLRLGLSLSLGLSLHLRLSGLLLLHLSLFGSLLIVLHSLHQGLRRSNQSLICFIVFLFALGQSIESVPASFHKAFVLLLLLWVELGQSRDLFGADK